MKEKTAPRWPIKLLGKICPDHLLEEIEGDLLETWANDVKQFGRPKARRRFIMNALRYCRPGIILRNKFSANFFYLAMLTHFAKVLGRVTLKHKSYTLINLAGLVIGMTASLLIGIYVVHESTYDKFDEQSERIFRLRNDRFNNGELNRRWAAGPMSIGSDLKKDFPEVVRFVRLNSARRQSYVMAYNENSFKEEKILYASDEFFRMFSFPLTKGIDSLVLRRPFTMVISESMAKRYFGDADPVGKVMVCNKNTNYEVTGVFKDLPENTHFRFDALFSFESFWKILGPEETNSLMTNWGWIGTYTYVELRSKEDAPSLQSKMHDYVDRRMGSQLRDWNEWMDFILQPIASIHLDSNEPDEIATNGDRKSVRYLIIIAVFVLSMAWINYINLATARSLERAREVGVRKILGSNRGQLIRQFLFESAAFNIVALVIAFGLVTLLLPAFSSMASRKLDLSLLFTTHSLLLIGSVVLTGVSVVSIYPALILSGYNPLAIIKGMHSAPKGILLRKGLVTVQFICSAVLISATLIVYQQLTFMKSSSTGMQTDQVLVVHGPVVFEDSTYRSMFSGFRNALLSFPDIKAIAVSTDVPGHAVKNFNGNVRVVGQGEEKGNVYQGIMANEDFLAAYDLRLIAGKNFSGNDQDEWNSVLVNETAMRQLGFTDPEKLIGQKIYLWDSEPEVIGIVKDYHQQSLKSGIPPLAIVFDKGIVQYFSIRMSTNKPMKDIVNQIKVEYAKSFPGNPFQYFFMEDYFDQQYESDSHFARLINTLMVLVVIIACLGLLGLSSYSVQQRRKEITIRKLLGASVRQITMLVSRGFLGIVFLANIIALPIIHFTMDNWLSGFAYRTNIGAFSLIVPVVLTVTICALTIASQSIKAATTNVVNNLKSE